MCRAVVVGVDGSGSALLAVRWAAVEARRRRAPLWVVNVCPWPKHQFGGETLGLNYVNAFVRLAREQVAAAAAVARDAAPSGEVAEQVVIGYPVPVLLDEARRAQLVVLGSRGLGGVTGLVVGSVAVALAAHAACPVVVVRGEASGAAGSAPVVVGVGDGPDDEVAIGFGFHAAEARGVPLVAVHAWRHRPVPGVAMAGHELEDRHRRVLVDRLARWREKYPDVVVRPVLAVGRASSCLLAEAAHAQLVVVGSHRRRALTGLLLGSVGHALLRGASCPVAVVPPDAAAADFEPSGP